MQKVVQFLEKYVQWCAVALGLAFLGYMGWAYIYKNPASQVTTIGTETVTATPGNVDRMIDDGPASKLDSAVRSQHPGFTIAVPKADGINVGPTTKPVEVASVFDSWNFDLSTFAPKNGGPGQVLVDVLPTLPALKYMDQEPLRTVLLITDANGNATHQDEDSVTTFWSLSVADLAKSFKDAFAGKLPEPQQLVQFIRAVVVRQELLPDGKWGPDEIVSPPPVPPGTSPQPEYPDLKDPKA